MPCSERLPSTNHLTKRCRERGNKIKGSMLKLKRDWVVLGNVGCVGSRIGKQVSCIVCSIMMQFRYWIYTATTVVQFPYKWFFWADSFSDSKQMTHKPFWRCTLCILAVVFHKCYHIFDCLVLLFTILDFICLLNDHETLFNSLKLF